MFSRGVFAFATWTDKNSSELKWTSLTGNDYHKLLSELPEKLLFTIQNDTHDEVVYLWREFSAIHKHITKEKISKTELFDKIKNWMTTFVGLSKNGRLGYSRVTPYMHCLLFHIPTIIEKHGLLGSYSGQGVEKLNDRIKMIHQKNSNKLNQSYDELLVRKRIEFLQSFGYEREKRSYTKKNTEFWESEIKEKRFLKRQKVESDISLANKKYKERMKTLEKPLSELSVFELKEKLKKLGIITKVRKHEKLVELLQKHTE